jgi:hypothetical protein
MIPFPVEKLSYHPEPFAMLKDKLREGSHKKDASLRSA